MPALAFAVCHFQNVFDTTPARETITLEELIAGLTRFQLRPDIDRQAQRSIERIDAAWAAWSSGGSMSGRWFSTLARAERDAKAEGKDPKPVVQERYERLRYNASHDPKRQLRIWSPACYSSDARRGSEHVAHLSCLVLDYDQGQVQDATVDFAPWFHILHTTWSHREDRHRFRIVLPLAAPVVAADWPRVWSWGARRASAPVDPSGSGAGSTFALPVLPHAGSPRVTIVNPGALLDPVGEGLIERSASPIAPLPPIPGSPWREGEADKQYVTAVAPEEDGDDDDWDFEI